MYTAVFLKVPYYWGRISNNPGLWQPAPSRGAGVWQAALPATLRQDLAASVPAGAGRLEGEIVELQYGGGAAPSNGTGNSSTSRSRLWRARHPNLDPVFPTIFGAGYLTASGGVGSMPCAFRSPRVTIDTPEETTVDCAISSTRGYPAEPPTGLTFEMSQLAAPSPGALPGVPISNWTTGRGIVHASIYARPPDQGASFSGGYAWIQNNLQYTVAGIREQAPVAPSTGHRSVEISFEYGGQQVNGYSWVLGAANIQNGSRWYMENVPEFLDAPSEFWHDVRAGQLYLRPPPGVSDPSELVGLMAVTAQRLLDVGRRTSAGVSPVQHLHFQGLELSSTRPTFLEEYEVPYRGDSDWTIHRGGAVTFEGVSDVSLSDSVLVTLGGNAVFISGDSKNVVVSGNDISDVGDSGIAVLGSMLRSTGLGARHFPLNVSIRHNTIREIGRFGKQVAGLFISTAGFVTASDNTISGSPSSGLKINDGFIGGHVFEYNHIFDVCREVTDMGAINLHNRDRFYYNFGTSIYDQTQADYSAWGAPFTGPNPRGPTEVDTVHPITIRRNRLEVTQHVGVIGQRGEWWGHQNTLSVLDIDDGNARYLIEENVMFATGVTGLKLGHIVDDMTVRNNIVVGRKGPTVTGAGLDPEDVSNRMDLVGFEIGNQCMENTMNASNNIVVNIDGGVMKATNFGSGFGMPGMQQTKAGAAWYLNRTPKPTTMDYNLYWCKGGSVRMLPNQTVAQDLLGLDVHSLIGTEDPLLDLTDLGAVYVREGSPALRLGFHNFPYGPQGGVS